VNEFELDDLDYWPLCDELSPMWKLSVSDIQLLRPE